MPTSHASNAFAPNRKNALLILSGVFVLCLMTRPSNAQEAADLPATDAKEHISFTQQIRPLLSNACFHCHGPAAEDREADLRLDVRADAFAVIETGHPDQSELYERISSDDEEIQMPPPDSGKQLTSAERELIRKWIEQGAEWSEHWAFVPPTRPAIPAVNNQTWVNSPIDAFVLRQLESNGLSPSGQAGKLTLLRRLHLDLTGLPPTVREIDQYLEDTSDDAYANKVEELLRSPHYGEKWARHWLDAARYSDSDGFEKDKPRFVWNYRDWVVRSMNQDLPYDQFLIDQLAGDLLPNATQDQLIATGFLRNSMLNEEGGVDPEQFRMEAMFDRMDAIGKSVLGLTIQCSQCHNHKYDPITQEEYYQMFAFINNSYERNAVVYSPAEELQRDAVLRGIAKIESDLRDDMPDWQSEMASWEDSIQGRQPKWTVLEIENSSGSNSERYYRQPDDSLLAQGYAPARGTSKFAATTDEPAMRAIRLQALPHPNLPAGGPGRGLKGLFALSEIKLSVSEAVPDADAPAEAKSVTFVRATADYSNESTKLGSDYYSAKDGSTGFTGSVSNAIDGDAKTAWGIDAGAGRRNATRTAVFVADQDFAYPEGTRLEFQFVQQHGGWNSDDNQSLNLGRFRIAVSDSGDAAADPIPADVQTLLEIPRTERTPRQLGAIFSYWRTTVPDWRSQNEQIESLWKLFPEGTMQLVMMERSEQARTTYLLERGDFLKPKQAVQPGVPSILHEIPSGKTSDRLTLARWLASRRSPTVARAAVNRAWQAFFGVGIVATSEDLGSQGEAPSHPDLLDWLAVEFMDQGWSTKELHRNIVHSATYQQDSRMDPELLQRDPYNRLLAHGPRFRVDGELVRDIALFASGLLNLDMGGPGVYPPSSPFLYLPPTSYGPKRWPSQSVGRSKYRRALYTFRFRSVPHPVLKNFDTPNGDASCVRRDRSNTPLQALTTLNEPLFFECAQAMALKTIQQGGKKDEDRIEYAFRSSLTRNPTVAELDRITALLTTQRKRLESNGLSAADIMNDPSGEPAVQPLHGVKITQNELAEWTIVCRVILNLDEAITKE